MKVFFRFTSRFLHFLLEIDEYSIHSPFLFDFYINCIKKAGKVSPEENIEMLRRSALTDRSEIIAGDWGSSSLQGHHSDSIRKIARTGITHLKYSLLYREMIRYFGFRNIVDLGTSIGINTLYLAGASEKCLVHTFEGNPGLIRNAQENFRKAGAANIRIVEGNIDEQLPGFIDSGVKPEFVFFDANHLYEPTLNYFNLLNRCRARNAVFVFDDIHWSRGMNRAWNDIRIHPDVNIDLDLYQCGILIFGPDLPKLSAKLAF